jgi:alpha-1,2-glucosyltransferase
VLTLKVFRGVCSVEGLRQFNVFALLSLTTYVVDIRSILTSRTALRSGKLAAITPEAVHTAVNIALFPPLFFFSGLFYTDVLATRFVLEVYRMFLIRKGVEKNSGEGLVMNYVIGIFALTMRQTNIFWVAIYLGGLEAVRAIKMNVVREDNTEKGSGVDSDPLMTETRNWGRGNIHDIALEDANLIGKSWIHP